MESEFPPSFAPVVVDTPVAPFSALEEVVVEYSVFPPLFPPCSVVAEAVPAVLLVPLFSALEEVVMVEPVFPALFPPCTVLAPEFPVFSELDVVEPVLPSPFPPFAPDVAAPPFSEEVVGVESVFPSPLPPCAVVVVPDAPVAEEVDEPEFPLFPPCSVVVVVMPPFSVVDVDVAPFTVPSVSEEVEVVLAEFSSAVVEVGVAGVAVVLVEVCCDVEVDEPFSWVSVVVVVLGS